MSQAYSFSSKQFKIIIKKITNTFTFMIINEDTSQFFQSQQIQLKRISEQTLSTAFDSKIHNITHQFKYQSENILILTIKVALEFLPQFSQDILLNRKENSHQQIQKVFYLQLQNEIKNIEKELDETAIVKQSKSMKVLQKGMTNIYGDEQILWDVELNKGEYLMECSGCSYSQCYDQNYDDQSCDQFGNYGVLGNYCTKSNLAFKVMLDKQQVYQINQKPFDYSNYEYPYVFSTIFRVQDNNAKMIVTVKDAQSQNAVINSNNLFLRKMKRPN